ncbi:hypothetical protein PFNF135_01380 [Plasmodium falciparum NF135/5.C10]|uniref:Uncharacterized protein n=2 Tax=Plasmodium falciparum TaxID=5833 RepID=A0A024XDC0_PLAFC|nr:hypothetical protein PFNF135_01380 [Plasmodium falciparum NF135/5.C10]ETW62776.1 hypothetical protein PFMC_01297 [Plasmodium falciparum CAMP/Malaysia]
MCETEAKNTHYDIYKKISYMENDIKFLLLKKKKKKLNVSTYVYFLNAHNYLSVKIKKYNL